MRAPSSTVVAHLLAAFLSSRSVLATNSIQLSDDLLLNYQINVPSDTTYEICDMCTISIEAIYDGEAWVGIGFSTDGVMVGSEAVVGIPGQDPQKYSLSAESTDGVAPMPDSAQTLTDASVEVNNGQTIMKFTKIMKEAGEIEITSGKNIFLWAYGSSDILGLHAHESPFDLDLSSLSTTESATPEVESGTPDGESGTPEVESNTPEAESSTPAAASVSSSKHVTSAALALIGLTMAFGIL